MDLGESYPEFDVPEYDGLISALEDHRLTTSQLLAYSDQEISNKCNRSVNEIARFRRDFLEHAKTQFSPVVENCHDLLLDQRHSMFSTGDAEFDEMLQGGIRTQTVTEFVGEAGCGKSHILTQLAMVVQRQPEEGGLGRAAIYVTTEKPLAKVRLDDFEKSTGCSAGAILVYKCPTIEQLQQCLLVNVPRAVRQFDVGVVLIDSIAQPFRGKTLKDTQSILEPMINSLKWQSKQLDFAIVAANQVTSVFPSVFTIEVDRDPFQYDFQTRWHSGWTNNTVTWKTKAAAEFEDDYTDDFNEPPLRPYCGNVWSVAVDIRVALKRVPRTGQRTLQVVFSPWAPPAQREFHIQTEGVSVLPDPS